MFEYHYLKSKLDLFKIISNWDTSTLLFLTHVAKAFGNLRFLQQLGEKFADVRERSLVELKLFEGNNFCNEELVVVFIQ